MVEAFAISDRGLVRETNEDSYICNPHLQLYVVADGMGGHSAGEVASGLAIETIEEFISRSDDAHLSWPFGIDEKLSLGGNKLRTAVHLANRRVFCTSESRDDYAGMGTTVTAVLLTGATLSCAHVGDSRLYALRNGELEQVTRDDSWVETLLANEPSLNKADLAQHPMRHVLTNVVGARDQVDVQLSEFILRPETVLLLCSDGLHGMTDEQAVAGIMRRRSSLDEIGSALLQAALEAGGHDNITAVLIRYTDQR